MAFKFIAFFATLAVATQAASVWPNRNQQDQRHWQPQDQQLQWTRTQSGGSPSEAVSTNWAWNENRDRRMQQQDQPRHPEDQQQWQWQQVQGQDQWNGNGRNWDNNNEHWNQEERQQQNWDDEKNDDHPRYEFGYEVRDPRSGDFKTHRESRDGDLVRGQYSMLEADGTRRVVDYTSDPRHGFNANVRKEGWARHD